MLLSRSVLELLANDAGDEEAKRILQMSASTKFVLTDGIYHVPGTDLLLKSAIRQKLKELFLEHDIFTDEKKRGFLVAGITMHRWHSVKHNIQKLLDTLKNDFFEIYHRKIET